jgi:pimeloyl-ACP methyl ester carboxylesterase
VRFDVRTRGASSLGRLALVAIALAVTACGPPVNVKRVSPREAAEELTRSALDSDRPSVFSENVLYRWNLREQFEKDPEGALAAVRQRIFFDPDASPTRKRSGTFALAELCFKHAEDAGRRAPEYYLAAAIYAYGFLFPGSGAAHLDELDPRPVIAADLYNRGLAKAFESADGKHVELRSGVFPLPFGQQLAVRLDPAGMRWGDRNLEDFVPVAELSVKGLGQRYRRPGIGAPLAAGFGPDAQRPKNDYLAVTAAAPVTALLRIDDAKAQLAQPTVDASLRVFNAYETRAVDIQGERVPLEVEPTAALAYGLSKSKVWGWELRGFLVGDLLGQATIDKPLAFVEPYRRGRIPLVFVHGTASSPGRWANMLNDLSNRSTLRDRYQYWFFFYETNNPIPYSAMKLRETLTQAVHELDPAGTDPALEQMVVIGHSQGGLLTKMTAIDSGDQLWKIFSKKPPEQLNVSADTRDLLRRTLFVKPLSFVREVIFISTPHRGSYVAGWGISRWISRFARFPGTVLSVTTDLFAGDPDAVFLDPKRPAIGAVYGMSPGSRFIKALAPIPIAPDVRAHSIIPIKGNLPPEGQNDGVVKYDSAHIDGVASELIVERQTHSAQDNPLAIEEVRRILAEHADRVCATSGVACSAEPPPAKTEPAPRRLRRPARPGRRPASRSTAR